MVSLADKLRQKQIAETKSIVTPEVIKATETGRIKEQPAPVPVVAKPKNPLAAALANRNSAKTSTSTNSVLSKTTPGVSSNVSVAVNSRDNSQSALEHQSGPIENPSAKAATETHFTHPTQPDSLPLTAEEDLKKSIKMLVDNFNDRPLVGQAISHIMLTLQEKPQLQELLAPEDYQAMVRGLRECYGTAVREKQQKTVKRETKAKEKSEVAGELDAIMAELNVTQ